MPVCLKCLHRGEDHNWTVPECSRCGGRDPFACANCQRNRELQRVRGACRLSGNRGRCLCSKYEPMSDERRRSVNPFAGRILRRKRR